MKTTKHHFKVFKKEVIRLLNLWGVPLWDLSILHGGVDPHHAADCWFNISSRKAVIRLSDDWVNNGKITDRGIRESARHECVHLLLAPLAVVAESRWTTRTQFEAGEHELLEVLMRMMPTTKMPKGR